MNREIKFRGKDGSKWHYGYWYEDGLFTFILELDENDFVKHELVLASTIGQYTGLHDSNDNEIYEGDIIKSPMGNIAVVEFGIHEDIVHSKEASMQGYKSDSFQCTGWIVRNTKNNTTGFLDWSFVKGEIIGNIYDNPELLNP